MEIKDTQNEDKPSIWMYVVLVILMGFFIALYFVIDETVVVTQNSTLVCLANNSQLYVSIGCGACNRQRQLLGEDLSMLNIIDCRMNPQACTDANIQAVPTWVIGNESYVGIRQIEELKELTNCS